MTSPVFCALDTKDIDHAISMTTKLRGHVHGVKLGLEFFLAHGAVGFERIRKTGNPIFLDLKLHDIPNTVAGSVASLLPLAPAFLTLHAAGGAAMMRAAVDVAAKAGSGRPKILAVTVLTSLDKTDLNDVGQGSDTAQQVLRLAKLARDNGVDGVVCSPEEITMLRRELGADFILMVPGIRPTWSETGDQKRVMTPYDAMQAGASYLVIGRPITGAADITAAAERINTESAS